MNLKASRLFLGVGILALWLPSQGLLHAQAGDAALSGTVKDPSGAVVPNAKVSRA